MSRGVFLADLLRRLVELHLVVVVADEDIEVVAKDGGGLKQRVVRRDATVGPDVEDQLVVIGALADTRVLHRVLDAGDRREDRVDGDHADRLVGMLVFVAGGEAAADLDLELGIELLLSVERADVLIGIDDLDALDALDVAGGHGAFLRHRDASPCERRGRAP